MVALRTTVMSNIIEKIRALLEGPETESYSRYDGQHPLDIFLGIDNSGRKSLVITLLAEKERVVSSKTITVEFFKRNDSRLSLKFSLEDDSLKEIFYKFCEDVIESTKNNTQESGFSPIIRRWNTWIDFFTRTSLSLSESEIIGLIGELKFLKNYMVDKYKVGKALDSFIGVDKAHKDFEVNNTWYEVKTIHHGVRSIKISSIEQLDSEQEGSLVVVTLDQGTHHSKDCITLNKLVLEIKSILEENQAVTFDEKMRKAGYIYDERYDEYVYMFVKMDFYSVRDNFPRISINDLPIGVTKASYEIDISSIQQFKDYK